MSSTTNGIPTWTTPRWCCSRSGKSRRTIRRKRDECFQRGLKWMMTFQCKDGGWAAFDKDCTKNILEKVPFADHNAMLDPECADITARILELLGYENWKTDHPQVKEALQFIREHQEPDGSWYGRWGVNYIYGTWQVLRGLRAMNLEHERAVAAPARPRLARKRPARRRRLGRTLQHLRRPGFQGPRPEHRVANRVGRHGPVRVRRPGKSRAETRHRVSLPHAKSRRLVDGGRDDRHRFPEGVLSEIRHLSQRLAAAGAGDLQENLPARQAGGRPAASQHGQFT